jgi:DNA-binding NarL/FixJ family response regulator
MTKVMLMDDEDMARRGMSQVLGEAQNIMVVAESRVSRAAVTTARLRKPNVVLVGVRGEAALHLVGDLARGPETRVLVITSAPTDTLVYGAISAGASGLLLRDTQAEELVYAVRKVADGHAVVDPMITSWLLDRLRSSATDVAGSRPAAVKDLSPRELDVLARVAAGWTNQEIARSIQVSLATVKSHVSNILAKLGVRDRLGAALLARQAGIVAAPEQ